MDSKPMEEEPPAEDVQSRLKTLEQENKTLRDEFNGQRAKMKELYLQKEAECKKLTKDIETITKELNEAKSQILVMEYRKENEFQTQERKAQEEIASLRQLVHETIEESSTLKDEQKQLYDEYEKIKSENRSLKESITSQQDSPSLAPVLSQVKKIARKLGADSSSHDNLEDSMRKAQEDAEVLRSLVVPLEEEIKALKEKLRTTDEELQKLRGISNHVPDSALVGMLKESQVTKSQDNSTTLNDDPTTIQTENSSQLQSCQMCQNYETQLVQAQKILTEEKQEKEMVQKQVERLKEELNKEGALRHELETQWQEKRELHKREVSLLTEQIKKTDEQFGHLQRHYNQLKDDISQKLLQITHERENVHRHLETLQRDNDVLSGKYLASSEELQNNEINLPDNVEELHEMLLKVHQNLIEARIGYEFEQTKSISLWDESQLLRDQLETFNKDRQGYEREITAKMRSFEDQIKEYEGKVHQLNALKENYERKEISAKRESSELREQTIQLHAINEKLEKANADLKQKVSTLQQDLANGEAVQQDFVRLSQSLQMQLEKIRVADTQVRWQDDDDVDQCANCKAQFTVTKRKQHCRHCGAIYCDKCLSKSVPSGPSKKPARVCNVCHTILVRNTAPYFSQAPPQSP